MSKWGRFCGKLAVRVRVLAANVGEVEESRHLLAPKSHRHLQSIRLACGFGSSIHAAALFRSCLGPEFLPRGLGAV